MAERGEHPPAPLLLAMIPPPPDEAETIREILTQLFIIASRPPSPLTNVAFRNFAEDENVFTGRNVFGLFSSNRFLFFQATPGASKHCVCATGSRSCSFGEEQNTLVARCCHV